MRKTQSTKSAVPNIALLVALAAAKPAMAYPADFPPIPGGKEVVFSTQDPLRQGILVFRVELLTSEKFPNSSTIYNTYEVERHDRNCTAAIIRNISSSGNRVGWTSLDERETAYYGRITDQHPAPIYYYSINLINNVLERRLLGKVDMAGNLKVGETESIPLIKYELDWTNLLERVRYNVC